MRLSEIRKIILENVEQLNYQVENSNQNGYILVRNIAIAVDAIERLSHLIFLIPSINKLRSYGNIYNARTPVIQVPAGEFEPFRIAMEEFKGHCKIIIALANEVTPPIEEQTICIKLFQTANISDVKKLITALDEITSQTSNLPGIDGSARFAGFESGTDWINIAITGTAYITFLNLLIEGAYSITNHYMSIKMLKQKCSGMSKLDEGLGDVERVLKALSDKTVDQINNDNNLNLDPDTLTRTSNVMKTLVGVLADGNTVLASLNAPIDTQSKIENNAKQISNQLQELKLLTSPESVPEQFSANDESIE